MRSKIVFKRFSALSLLLFLIIVHSDAQDLVYQGNTMSYQYSHRDFILELSPNYVYREDVFPRITGNINMQYFVARNVSLNGNLSLGQDYAHFGFGLLGIPLMTLVGFQNWFRSDDFLMPLLIIICSFENTAFHIPAGNNLDISPYFSLMRFQYLYKPPPSQSNDFSACFILGSRLTIFLSDHWIIGPYFEYTRTYTSGMDGVQGGIYTGYYFKSRVTY
jgi:hypothetical protein